MRCSAVLMGLTLAAGLAVPTNADEAYRGEIEKWRSEREARLEADGGWLSVAGLFWLKEGPNRFGSDPSADIVLPESAPANAGVLVFQQGKTALRLASGVDGRVGGKAVSGAHVMQPDTTGRPDVLTIGDLSLYVIERGDRYGVRVKDKSSPARRDFTGLKWFEIDESWRIEARWASYPTPRPLKVPNVLGEVTTMPSPGLAEFEIDGHVIQLDGVLEDPSSLALFFIIPGPDEREGDLRVGPLPLRRSAEEGPHRPGLQQGLQSAVHLHALRHLPAAPEAELAPGGHRGRRKGLRGRPRALTQGCA